MNTLGFNYSFRCFTNPALLLFVFFWISTVQAQSKVSGTIRTADSHPMQPRVNFIAQGAETLHIGNFQIDGIDFSDSIGCTFVPPEWPSNIYYSFCNHGITTPRFQFDIDLDGMPDLIGRESGLIVDGSGSISYSEYHSFLNVGGQRFFPQPNGPDIFNSSDYLVFDADLDNDGKNELIRIRRYSGISYAYIYLADYKTKQLIQVNDGENVSPFLGYAFVSAETPREYIFPDYDGDGITDIVTRTESESFHQDIWLLFRGLGNFQFDDPQFLAAGPVNDIAISSYIRDVTGDNIPELVSVTSDCIFLTFRATDSIYFDDNTRQSLCFSGLASGSDSPHFSRSWLEDLDGDGDFDLVLQLQNYSAVPGGVLTVAQINRPDVSLLGLEPLPTLAETFVFLEDYNGDNKIDLMLYHDESLGGMPVKINQSTADSISFSPQLLSINALPFYVAPQAVVGARIRLENSAKSYARYSDSNGFFQIANVLPGQYTVSADLPNGQSLFLQNISVGADNLKLDLVPRYPDSSSNNNASSEDVTLVSKSILNRKKGKYRIQRTFHIELNDQSSKISKVTLSLSTRRSKQLLRLINRDNSGTRKVFTAKATLQRARSYKYGLEVELKDGSKIIFPI